MTDIVLPEKSTRPLLVWLGVCCAMIAAMIVIGAVTRLTESGLSMVEWRAMMDMLPPLNDAAWLSEFEKYKATPEFIQKNSHMNLQDFRAIYFWEWFHRLWGRLIGLVYALPLVYFWVRGFIPSRLKPRFIVFLLLGGLQGFIGWFMVKSGLVNEPRVSHYRLALHLCAALVLFEALWAQMLLLWPRFTDAIRLYRRPEFEMLQPHLWGACVAVVITIIWGAFVAGLDAGQIYNEFPLMGGHVIPGEFLFFEPWGKNFFDNHATVQWLHRVLAMISFVTVFSLGLRALWMRNFVLRIFAWILMITITVQFTLGIVTLLSQVALHPAAAHQFGALVTLTALVSFSTYLYAGRKN